jgi:NADH-quinone oxidoreductase subunit M
MLELNIPWLELTILTPLVGVLAVAWVRDPEAARSRSLVIIGAVLCMTLVAWLRFSAADAAVAHDRWSPAIRLFGPDSVIVDEVSAPLLPLAALLYFVVTLTTLRTKVRRFRFSLNLVSLSLLMALINCRAPWGIVALSVAQVIPPWIELRARRRSTRVFLAHMALFAVLLVAGWALTTAPDSASGSSVGVLLLAAAVLVRCGVVPAHCWMTDLFENAGLGTALLFVTPMSGAYIAVRLLLPVAPDWTLRVVTVLSLLTALYAAGMALVQNEVRRFYCYLFLSNASLVLVGLEVASPTSLTGALALWLSVGIALAGLGLTLRAIEARCGRLSLRDYHGLYDHMPRMAVFFLLTALASIGFPGTIGFVGAELLVEGVVQLTPIIGMLVVLTGALNGIAVLRTYFKLFTGTRHTTSISLEARLPEKIAVLAMTLLILGGGLWPQPGVASRYNAATKILEQRRSVQARAELHHSHQVAINTATSPAE